VDEVVATIAATKKWELAPGVRVVVVVVYEVGQDGFWIRRDLAERGEESRYPGLPLQPRQVDVQIHPVDPLQLQGDVLAQNFGNAAWCAHIWLRSFGIICQPLCGPIAGTASAIPLVNRSPLLSAAAARLYDI
jgi:hypothetical protein